MSSEVANKPPSGSAAELGKTALLVRMNELQSENHSLRSRLQSTLDELRTAQRLRKHGSPLAHQRASSVEISCTMDREVQTTGPSNVDAHMRITKLQHELQQKGERIASLEQQVSFYKNAASPSEKVSRSSPRQMPPMMSDETTSAELVRLQAQNAALGRLQAVSALDNGSTGVSQELRAELAHALEQKRALQSRVDELQRENWQQRSALGLDRSIGETSLPARRDDGNDEPRALISKMQTLFRLYGKRWSYEELERLLQQDESFEVDRRLQRNDQDNTAGGGGLLHIQQTLVANQQLRDELSAAKDSLMQAHQKIEELTVTVQLHGKYQDLRVSKSAEVAASESAHQAATEIAFLCDTLAAMKAETEYLNRKLTTATSERDCVAAAFEELRVRSEQMLHGCETIATTTQQDAHATIQATQAQLRSRERELSLLRGELLSITRQLDEQRQLKVSLENELVECRTKLMSIKETCSNVRTEAKQAKLDKQAALTQVTSLQKQLSASQEKARLAEAQLASAQMESSRFRARPEPHRFRTVSPSATSHETHDDKTEGSSSPTKNRSLTPGTTYRGDAKSRAATDDCGELKQCFVILQALVPDALTARDVTTALRTSFDKSAEHRRLLEAELRKKSSALAKAKKTEVEQEDLVNTLKKKVAHLSVLERKLEGKDKLIDKTKRELQSIKDEDTKAHHRMRENFAKLSEEKNALQRELSLVQQELDEGKEVMVQLLREHIVD
jgi:hypothetical protein